MTTTENRDHSVTTIDGWVPLGLHKLLQRAAAIGDERRHPYLGDEHLAVALTESRIVTTTDGRELNLGSALTRVWPDAGKQAITLDELHELLVDSLPDADKAPLLAESHAAGDRVSVETEYHGPHADEIRDQLANNPN